MVEELLHEMGRMRHIISAQEVAATPGGFSETKFTRVPISRAVAKQTVHGAKPVITGKEPRIVEARIEELDIIGKHARRMALAARIEEGLIHTSGLEVDGKPAHIVQVGKKSGAPTMVFMHDPQGPEGKQTVTALVRIVIPRQHLNADGELLPELREKIVNYLRGIDPINKPR